MFCAVTKVTSGALSILRCCAVFRNMLICARSLAHFISLRHTHTHIHTNSPVMSIMKWKTLEEVAYRANNTPFGLAAGIWSKSADTIQYLSRTLKAGSVFVNCYNIFDAALPFGGARPGMYCNLFLFRFAGPLEHHAQKTRGAFCATASRNTHTHTQNGRLTSIYIPLTLILNS